MRLCLQKYYKRFYPFILICLLALLFSQQSHLTDEYEKLLKEKLKHKKTSSNVITEEKNVTLNKSLFTRYKTNYFLNHFEKLKKLSNVTTIPSRVFSYRNKPFPCFQISSQEINHDEASITKGNLYIKLRKSASSTLAGVALRIGYNSRTNLSNPMPCFTNSGHGQGEKFQYRSKEHSVLYTFIRNPASRFISDLNFEAAIKKNTSLFSFRGLRKFEHQLQWVSKQFMGYQLGYISLNRTDSKRYSFGSARSLKSIDYTNLYNHVQNTLEGFDFLGLVERLDESLVLLRLLLGLSASDILYISAKKQGSFDAGRKDHVCRRINIVPTTSEISEFFSKAGWFRRNIGDYLLYLAVNQSIDKTIESIGREVFDEALGEHLYLLNLIDKECQHRVTFPCSLTGIYQEKISKLGCYEKDAGCGYKCIDEVFLNYSLGNYVLT